MKLRVIGEYDFDRNDPRNNGVIFDQMIAHSGGTMIRRVIYVDPVIGKRYRFLTKELTIPPGPDCLPLQRTLEYRENIRRDKKQTLRKKSMGNLLYCKMRTGEIHCYHS